MNSSQSLAASLADAIHQEAVQAGTAAPGVRRADWQTAIVTAVNADGTVEVGDIVARRLDSYPSPVVGDKIFLTNSGIGNWVAVGRTAAANAGIGQTLFAYKTADTSRTSTTTPTNDPHLTMQVAPNAIYTIEGYAAFIAGGTGDIRIGFTVPAGAEGAYAIRGADISIAAGTTTAMVRIQSLLDFTSTIPAGGQTPTFSSAHPIGMFVTAGTGGTFAVKWCQNVSDPTASTMLTHSWIKLQRQA